MHDLSYHQQLAQRAAVAVRERLATDRLTAIVRERLGGLLLNPTRRQLLQAQA